MKKELKMLCKVRNTLLPNKNDSFIQTMISNLDSKILSIQKETGLVEDTSDTYKMRQKTTEYDQSDRDCVNLQIDSYDFVRGKIRKKFPETLRPMTEALVKTCRSCDKYLATVDPSESDYWYDCHCVAGENPYDNLENCRAHWMRENREDGFDASYWWRREPTLDRKISRLKKELAKCWENTHWIATGGSKVTIQDVLWRLKDEPIISVEISTICRSNKVLIETNRKDQADTTKFILLHKSLVLLDGYHRVAKALEMGATHIPAKILKTDIFSG